MFWKKYNWHKVADLETEIRFNRNGIGIVEMDGKKICVAKFKNEWHAFAYNCPHAGGVMADGYIDLSGNIVCPIHGYKFGLQNGRCKTTEGYCLKTFRAESRKDGFFIGVEENKGA
jgi:3-phenylpropionate/trans-cinnamate dioxygenase ferredoxin subunit